MAEPEGVEGVTDQDDDMPILRRRRIEAGIVAPIYRVMERELGTERAREILREGVAPGQTVVGAGSQLLYPGRKVRAIPAAPVTE